MPTFVSDEQRRAVFARIYGSGNPYTYPRDAFGNIIKTAVGGVISAIIRTPGTPYNHAPTGANSTTVNLAPIHGGGLPKININISLPKLNSMGFSSLSEWKRYLNSFKPAKGASFTQFLFHDTIFDNFSLAAGHLNGSGPVDSMTSTEYYYFTAKNQGINNPPPPQWGSSDVGGAIRRGLWDLFNN